nr:DUF4326 domain-containing protein [Mesorhizobium sp.]
MTVPVRLQLSRRKHFVLQLESLATNGLPAVSVARPTRWGNPWPVDHEGTAMHCLTLGLDGDDRKDRAAAAVDLFRTWIDGGKVNELVASFLARPGRSRPLVRHIQRDLRGKNLACWCRPGSPCHADVLLDLANRPACEEVSA